MSIERIIDAAWEARGDIGSGTQGEVRDAVEAAIAGLDGGTLRVAEKRDGSWQVNQWLKKAVLLSFRLNPNRPIHGGPDDGHWWDKVGSKFHGWGPAVFAAAGFRAVPGSIVRRGAYVAPGAVLMPSFVNIGARVGENSMIDTWATVGGLRADRRQCAHQRRHRHRRRAGAVAGRAGDHRG